MNYFKLYYNVINKALLEKRSRKDGYLESHHVKPRCMGGTFEVLLTGREHFICHLLLTKIYPKNKKLIYAFNNMLCTSGNQERHIPTSRWYEYSRKLFSDNHPMKDAETKVKHKAGMLRDLLKKNLGSFTALVDCTICQTIIYGKPQKFCNDCKHNKILRGKQLAAQRAIKRPLKLKKECYICKKPHHKKYCCSKECFQEYVKLPDNEFSKNLSTARSKYIKENPEKVSKAAQKSADNRDSVEVGKKISTTKKLKGSGNNNPHSTEIHIFNDKDELIYVSPKGESFKLFCEENNLPHSRMQYSYRRNTLMTNEFKGWYVIKVK